MSDIAVEIGFQDKETRKNRENELLLFIEVSNDAEEYKIDQAVIPKNSVMTKNPDCISDSDCCSPY